MWYRCLPAFLAVFAYLALNLLNISSADALTIDKFSGAGEVQVSGLINPVLDSATFSSIGAIGGTRTLRITRISGTLSATLETTSDQVLALSQGPGVGAMSNVIWDGDLNPNNLNPSGLGAVDLRQDGSDSFLLSVLGFDYPAGNAATLMIVVYDAADSTGATFSARSLVLSQQINSPQVFELPFSGFNIAGPGGGANFSRVGAIQLIIDGAAAPATDLVLDFFGTNGNCNLVPIGGPVVDICGVCGGNGTSCLDCAGVPFGSAADDRCGVCNGDGMSCLDCNTINQDDLLQRLDNGAKVQEALVKRTARPLLKLDGSKNTGKFVKSALMRAHTLQLRNWQISWFNKREVVICSNQVFCYSVDTGSAVILDEYRKNNAALRDLALSVIERLEALGAGGVNKLRARAIKLHDANDALADQVRLTENQCT